jgi:4-alpha-glucanotransferase
LADLAERAARWGVVPSYTGFKGDLIESPPATIEAILEAIATGDEPPAATPHPPGGQCAPAPERAWGWAVQLYAVRSRSSWGIGDLADLRRLGAWAKSAGASVLLISPLGAQPPTPHQEPCPYYSSSRRFRNHLYLCIEEIPGADACAAELEPLQRAGSALNAQRHIDHDAVFRLKTQALEAIFKANPAPKGLPSWVKSQGRALREFATFNAIAEIHGAAWRTWSASLAHPNADGIARAQRELANRIDFHTWVQYHMHLQTRKAAREVALIADVPVGFAADGFDAWRWQDILAPGMRVGAPPDYFFPDGQDWGMPPFDPWKLGAAHFEPLVEAIRSATAHAGGVRLDHVMSLFRLFWIPEGATPAAGAYVHYPTQPMVDILASESTRANAFVIGEDLGVVEPQVRTTMRDRGALGYRLLWFDDQPPAQWSNESVAAISTHDLPTVAGIWKRTEPDQRQHHLRERLVQATGMQDEADPLDVAVAAYASIASSPSRLALATLEDALRVEERPNIPGTISEWPNWRLAMPVPLEEIEQADGPARIAEVMAQSNRSQSSPN